MIHSIRSSRILAASVALVLATACVTTTTGSTRAVPTGPWLEPSPALRAQIEDRAMRLPWSHGTERVEMIQWFASVGEPGYTTLLSLARDPRPDVAGAAFAALGATRDSRLVESLRAVPDLTGPDNVDLRLERARTLLRLGDWQAVPVLISGLRDERAITRALCAQALFEATHEKFDFDPKGDPQAREQAIQRWNAWWDTRRKDPLLTPPKVAPQSSIDD
ncbi:MAG TPA: hypothetical protein VGR31_01735 [Planctomycetota bacterium]|jgi:hypothetical protein|nr:hypothetical protein [Planctomycetota bacterium]